MTAETMATVVTPLPGIRLLPVQRLSYDRRMQLLEQLARQSVDLERESPEFVTILRDALAHDSLSGPQLQQAWQEVVTRVALLDAAGQGIPDWEWSCDSCGHRGPDCGCVCCPAAYLDKASADADEALAWLAGAIR